MLNLKAKDFITDEHTEMIQAKITEAIKNLYIGDIQEEIQAELDDYPWADMIHDVISDYAYDEISKYVTKLLEARLKP